MRDNHPVIGYEKPPLSTEKIITIVGQRCPKALGDATGTARQTPIEKGNLSWSAFSTAAGDVGSFQHVSCSDETSVGLAWVSGDEVQRVVHSVGEVAIEVPGGTEHGLIPIRHTPIGVRAGVAFTGIGLDLGDANGYSAIVIRVLQDAAENFGCEFEHLAGKKCPVRQMKSRQHVHSNSVSALCRPGSSATFRASENCGNQAIYPSPRPADGCFFHVMHPVGTIAWNTGETICSPR